MSGVLEVEMDVIGNIAPEALEKLFKKGIAAAIGVPMELVVNITVSEVVSTTPAGSVANMTQTAASARTAASGPQRRLRSSSTQTKRYEVKYEVVVPETMDADAVIVKANKIAVRGSPESASFREELTKDSSVAAVGRIAIVEAAAKTKVGDQGDQEYNSAIPSDSTGLRMSCLSVAAALLWFTRSC